MVRSSSSGFVPAARPPPAVTKMIGRIRVDGEDQKVEGYLTLIESLARVSDIDGASVFEADSSAQTLRVKGEEKSIVIQAAADSFSLRPGTS
ncbi:hypothetical protein FRC00_004491, partial [Tulasnella sp. 408]